MGRLHQTNTAILMRQPRSPRRALDKASAHRFLWRENARPSKFPVAGSRTGQIEAHVPHVACFMGHGLQELVGEYRSHRSTTPQGRHDSCSLTFHGCHKYVAMVQHGCNVCNMCNGRKFSKNWVHPGLQGQHTCNQLLSHSWQVLWTLVPGTVVVGPGSSDFPWRVSSNWQVGLQIDEPSLIVSGIVPGLVSTLKA